MFIGDARLRYTHRKGLLATMVAREQVERRSYATVMTQSVSMTLGYAIVHSENQILKSNPMSLSIELVWSTVLSLCQAMLECINHYYVHIVTKGYNLNLNNKYSNFQKDSRQLQFSLDIALDNSLWLWVAWEKVKYRSVHFR